MKRSVAALGLLVLALAAPAGPAAAAPFTDALARCLVERTTAQDKSDMVVWMFAGLGMHPDVRQYVVMTPAQRQQTNVKMAALFDRLLTVDCRGETVAALKYEGTSALEAGFKVLGAAAANTLMAHPDVEKATGAFADLIDEAALERVLAEAGLPTK